MAATNSKAENNTFRKLIGNGLLSGALRNPGESRMRKSGFAWCTLGLLAACAAGDDSVVPDRAAGSAVIDPALVDEVEPPPDPESWMAWWECNQGPLLEERLSYCVRCASIDGHQDITGLEPSPVSLMPTGAVIRSDILPALRRALEQTQDPDLATASMVAMARSCPPPAAGFDLFEVLRQRVACTVPAIRRVAVLAIGIAAEPDDARVSLLLDLLQDSAAGRTACHVATVDADTRRFAAYGLGLIVRAAGPEAIESLRRSTRGLGDVLRVDRSCDPWLRAAAIAGLGVCCLSLASDGRQPYCDSLAALRSFYTAALPAADRRLQALCPPAMARLLRAFGDPALRGECKALLLADLEGQGGRATANHWLAQSAAIALGQLCRSEDDGNAEGAFDDVKYCDALLEAWHLAADASTRHFAVMALGQIGGKRNRTVLLREFAAARDAGEKAWLALALGVSRRREWEATLRLGMAAEEDPELGGALRAALAAESDPDCRSAVALALGLGNFREHAADLLHLMQQRPADTGLTGWLCVSLGLLRADAAKPDLRALVASASTSASLLRQAAIGLALLQDKGLVRLLLDRADAGRGTDALRATIAVLGRVGDREAVAPLLVNLLDENLPASVRAAAAAALGDITAIEDVSWSARLCMGTNYLASGLAPRLLATGVSALR